MSHSSVVVNRRGRLIVRRNLVLWLDASDESTISSSGDKVDSWSDKSGVNLTGLFEPFDSMFRPDYALVGNRINGLNTVTFVQESGPASPAQALQSQPGKIY